MTDSPFEKLYPALQYHVVNSLGWSTLRPTQLAAIEPILDGKDCLILAPTAGGKTEAAIIPVLSRMLTNDWKGLSVVYVCPIKALLNNLDERLSRYAALVGRSVQVWHGDINQSAKTRSLREPPDSRAGVEEVATGLRGRGVRTFVSHSSLSVSERKQAEQAFAQDPDCVIVATSTLELGIDVGDLDYVIQIDAPSTVSSFLQRMGRTGRRASSKRNCLFLTTTDEAFLIACALSQLWKEGYVEPVVPPPDPWHLVAQQAMALVLQSKDLGLKECSSKVASLFPELPESGICEVLNHMCATDILCVNDALLGFGRRGEKLYGRQNFLDLLSSFASPLQLLVRHGSSDLGYIDPISVQGKQDEDRLILLGGHSWRITSIDWSKRAVWVEPTRDPGKARWVGSGRSLAFEICQAIKRVLTGAGLGIGLSKRGIAKLESLRGELPVFNPASTTIEHMTNGRTRWWTFAGGRANWQLAQSMRAPGAGLRIDDFYIEKNGTVAIHEVRERLKALDLIDLSADLINSKAIDLKFQEAVPTHLLASVALKRALDRASAEQVLAQSIDTEPGCDHPSTKQTLADDKPLTMHPRRE